MFHIETLVYIVYVYSFIVIFINVNPSIINILFFFTYCFYTTWFIGNGCKHTSIVEYSPKLLITAQYSLFCSACYYLIHISWNKYKNHIYYRFSLAMLPLIYTLNIKIAEKIFNCGQYHNYNTAYLIYFLMIAINLIIIKMFYSNNGLL